jgi:hypothetical protein
MRGGTLMILGHAAAGLQEDEARAMAARWKGKGLDTWWGQRGNDPEAPDGWGAAWGRVLGATPHIDGVPGDPGPFAWGGGMADYPGATHHVALSREGFEAALAEATALLDRAGVGAPPRLHLLHIIEYEHESYLDAKPFGRPAAGPPPEVAQQGLRLVDQLVRLEWLELEPGADPDALEAKLEGLKPAQVEDLLLSDPAVAELYATTEQLGALLAEW